MAEVHENFEAIPDFVPQTDGTLAGATLSMPDIDALEVEDGKREPDGRARNEDGTFQAKEPVAESDTDDSVEEEPAEPEVEAAGDESDEDEDEDFLEFVAEEGAEPTRVKAADALAGYNRAQELEAENAKLKETPPAPPEYDEAIIQAARQGQEYLQRLQQLEQMLQPRLPSVDLVNPNSPSYDPEEYYNQQQAAEAQFAQLQHVQSERERVAGETNEQTSAAESARISREQAKLKEFWPEVTTEAGADKVRSEAQAHYNLPADIIDSVTDARFYAVLKDALEFRSMKKAKETTVSVVKAKPKLIKSKGRDPQTKDKQQKTKMARLAESGSRQDAADALEGLL